MHALVELCEGLGHLRVPSSPRELSQRVDSLALSARICRRLDRDGKRERSIGIDVLIDRVLVDQPMAQVGVDDFSARVELRPQALQTIGDVHARA